MEKSLAKTIKGLAIFLAQFASDTAPFNRLSDIAHWVAAFGYKGVQIPAWDGRLFDLKCAAESRSYCDEIKGVLQSCGLQLTELSTHLRGQLVAVHPAYDEGFDGFATGFCSQESFVSSGLGHRSAPLSRKGFRQPGA